MVPTDEVEQPVKFTAFNITLVEVEEKTQTELFGLTELDLRRLLDFSVVQRGFSRSGISLNEDIG